MYQIAVIGCGVIGLTSALKIQEKLHPSARVTIFTEKKSPNTTGDLAAGLWLPYLVQNTPKELVAKWSETTYEYILNLWKNGRAKEAGITLQLIVYVTDDINYELPAWLGTTLGYSELTKDQLDRYGEKSGPTKLAGGFSFVGFTWEAAKFLPLLEGEFVANGGVIVDKSVRNVADELAGFHVIVNCAGLQAAQLVPDPTVHPIRGQIMRMKASWQLHTFTLDAENCNYIIPNQNCVIIGGTHQDGDTNLNVDQSDRDHILEGCQKFFPALVDAEILNETVGLRPGRREVRLELELRRTAGKLLKIVHNYGHGGSGVTMAIGCAETCAEIVRRVLFHAKL